MGGDFVCYTLLYARNPHDSNRWFRIQVETWDDMAKLCFQHLKPNDHTYVSGHLESSFKVSSNGNPKSSYKAAKALSSQSLKPAKTRRNQSWKPVETLPEESELKPVETLPEESESGTCQKFKEPESGACQKSMEPHSGAEIGTGKDTTHLCLWKALFSSLFGWWDNKKNRSYPISGYALWLGPNEPPWIKRKVQLLDWKMGEHCEEERHKNLYLWQGFFTSHHEWWDYRNNKKNSRSPDFKHRDTGEALWLNPNYPPRVNLQIQFA